jgi:hypothetical protein
VRAHAALDFESVVICAIKCSQSVSRALRLRRLLLWTRPARDHRGAKTTARTKYSTNFGPLRLCRLHHVVQYLVNDVFLENAKTAVFVDVFLQRLQLEAMTVGHVTYPDGPKIRQVRLRTHGGKFRNVDFDFVSRKLIGKRLDLRKLMIETRFRVVGRVAKPRWFLQRHTFILPAQTPRQKRQQRFTLRGRLRLRASE